MPLLLEWGEEIHFSCVCEVETVLSLFIYLFIYFVPHQNDMYVKCSNDNLCYNKCFL